jgi:hypothetical protein
MPLSLEQFREMQDCFYKEKSKKLTTSVQNKVKPDILQKVER